MDKLDIDFNSLLPYVIDAFSSVYGEEYRSIISKKLNNALIIQYHDVEGLNYYVSYIKRCKAREFSIRFLEEIGIDVQEYKKSNYTEPLESNLNKILGCLIDANFGFSKDVDYWSPLRAFDTNNKTNPERLLSNKIKIVNYLLGNEREKITKENFEFFAKTKEFSELLKKINDFNVVYEKLLFEYNNWANQFIPYEKYVEDEKKRKEGILQKKKNELFREIFDQLPSVLKDIISNKSFEEQLNTILGGMDISAKSIIEFFRYEQMEKLKSSEVDLYDKFLIVYWQSIYLKKLGITIPNENMLNCDSDEDITNFLSFLNQEDIRKYIPSDELISCISSTREKKYEEALREYYTTRNDFSDVMKLFDNNPDNIEIIYSQIKNKNVCVMGHGGIKNNNEFISIMFYTIREFDGGHLFYMFMHENGHIIDQSQKGIGFESFDDFGGNYRKNPYDNAFRKYEKFNETLNDIFTQEAVKILQDQGIYLLEPEEFTKLDNYFNTPAITHRLLQPLVQKFRQQVIRAKVNANPEELIMYIGEDNFEELVDTVNKVDYLLRNDVISKIDKSPEDTMVIEYFQQVEKAKQIYINIDSYYANKFGNSQTDGFQETIKKR